MNYTFGEIIIEVEVSPNKFLNQDHFKFQFHTSYLRDWYLTLKKSKPMTMKTQIVEDLIQISPNLRKFAYKLTGNDYDAEDLYQETALRIYAKREKFRVNTNFEAWAKVIMRNLFINNYRKKARQNTYVDSSPNQFILNGADNAAQSKGESNINYKELVQMVQNLPENLKSPFWMSYKGYKYEEIAELLDTPMGTIKSRIFLARKQLQRIASASGF